MENERKVNDMFQLFFHVNLNRFNILSKIKKTLLLLIKIMVNHSIILEIACFSVESIQIALRSEADRIEFCKDYASGGLTPSIDELKIVRNFRSKPVFVMIRPRGGDFNYSDKEFEQMKKSIVQIKELDFDGVVFGILNEKNEVDFERNRILLELAKPMSVTFHRAFDKIENQFNALDILIEIDFDRVLTSGKGKTAVEGLEQLAKLNEFALGKIKILAGGGIRSGNVNEFLNSGMEEIHSAAIISGKICDENQINLMKNKLRI
jgi:copper homeostasis protein